MPQPAKAQWGRRSPSAQRLSSSPAIASSSSCLTPSSQQCMQPPADLFLLSRPLIAAPREPSVACPALLRWHCRRGVGQQRPSIVSLLPCPTHEGCSAQPSQGRKFPLWKQCNVSGAGWGTKRVASHIADVIQEMRCRQGLRWGGAEGPRPRDLLMSGALSLSVHGFPLSSLSWGAAPPSAGPLPPPRPAQPRQDLSLRHVPVAHPGPAAGSWSSPVSQR